MVDISAVNGIINQLITRGHHLAPDNLSSVYCYYQWIGLRESLQENHHI